MTNLTTTIETQKLQIRVTFTESKVIDKEVSIPYYFTDEYGGVCKIISKEHYICARNDNFLRSIQVLPVDSFKDRIAKGKEATEDQFNFIYESAIMHIQLLAEDQEADNEIDPNVQIDEILERRAS